MLVAVAVLAGRAITQDVMALYLARADLRVFADGKEAVVQPTTPCPAART